MFGRCDSYRPLSGKHLVRMVMRNDNCWEVSEVLTPVCVNVLGTSFGIVLVDSCAVDEVKRY